ncbi:hypothetical protein C2W64_02495 [Brevibacillus laterosporus]|nr:hypothetical protein [Brevibacillus laterosporus]RAP29940.1 hypothetical protein C2W64_02495 [Brevibacillus laterosporus]
MGKGLAADSMQASTSQAEVKKNEIYAKYIEKEYKSVVLFGTLVDAISNMKKRYHYPKK